MRLVLKQKHSGKYGVYYRVDCDNTMEYCGYDLAEAEKVYNEILQLGFDGYKESRSTTGKVLKEVVLVSEKDA